MGLVHSILSPTRQEVNDVDRGHDVSKEANERGQVGKGKKGLGSRSIGPE